MAAIRRPLTEAEHRAVQAALPLKLRPLMDEIEYVKTNCWNCLHYDGYEGQPGTCLLHGVAIPNDQRGKDQDCWECRTVPF